MGDGEDQGGIAAATADIIAQYQTTRVRALWTNYLRFYFLRFLSLAAAVMND
jgi:hypothetical protein